METNPLVPRQRNRRADRQAAETIQQVAPAQPMVPAQPMAPAQPVYQQVQTVQTVQPVYPPQPAPSQSPRTMYQQPIFPVPQKPQSYQQLSYQQQEYQQTIQSPAPQSQPLPQIRPAARPRVLTQSSSVNSGWQQPTLQARTEVPRARASSSLQRETARDAKATLREEKAPTAERTGSKTTRKKLPGWLTTALSLSFLLVLALVATYCLMQAYLVTEEEKRAAAYQAVLDNYHVTEQADGTLTVTWQEHIEKYAAQYNLQPAFVAAIIRNESSFRTNAESGVGARGLMQMMPDTAEWIAGKLDDPSYTFDKMYDAETNIRYGCWYLGYLTRLFHGDAELVSGAYHAGQTTITQWLSDRTKSSDGVSLDMDKLADGPTKQYIGRVTQTYGIYQTLLYPDEAFGTADSVSADSSNDAAADR